MKYLCLLVFICAISATLSNNLERPFMLGSVRDLGSGLPKCVGVFITPYIMLTTARCLFCDRDCNLTIYVNSAYNATPKQYVIESTSIHEEYDMSPHRHDIGFARVKTPVPPEAVVNLTPEDSEITRSVARSFIGKLINDHYYFETKPVKIESNAKCSFALNRYIPESQICAYSPNKFYFKEQDQGTPLVYFRYGKVYLAGMYVTANAEIEQGARLALYQSIFRYNNWLNLNALNKTDCNPVKPQPTTPKYIPTTTAYPTTNPPTYAPTHPTNPPTHPTHAPTHPTNPPTHPTHPPTHPTNPPTHPTHPPTHPTNPPTHPTNPPTYSTQPPTTTPSTTTFSTADIILKS